MEFFDRQEIERRLNICNSCEHMETVAKIKKCNLCGCICFLKASFPKGKCPANKWELK